MIEIFIGILLIVLATTFSNLEVVIAAMYLMLSQAHLISNAMYFVLAIIVTFFFPSAGLFSLVSISLIEKGKQRYNQATKGNQQS